MKRMLLFFCLLSGMTGLLAQTAGEHARAGDQAFADGDYFTASNFYRQALKSDSTNLDIAYQYAESCRLFNNYREAARWYGYVAKKDKRRQFPQARFWWGMMQKNNGNYKEAEALFKEFYKANKNTKDLFTARAKVESASCAMAPGILNDTLPVCIFHPEKPLNTPFSDFGALQLHDSLLLFSSLRPEKQYYKADLEPDKFLSRIYQSGKTMAGFSRPALFMPEWQNKRSYNANLSVSPDLRSCYFTRCKKTPEGLRCSIYYSLFSNGKWSKPVDAGKEVNMPGYTNTQPCITLNEGSTILYFASDRPGGFGGTDLWYSVMKAGKFTEAVNLGSNINTPGDEITPFYTPAYHTLSFSSDWLPGLGGFDIFRSKGGLNQWTTPVNAGFPLNSSCNDLYFTVNQTDSGGYFTSNRPGSFHIKGETCCYDLFGYAWNPPAKIPEKVPEKPAESVSIQATVKEMLPLSLYFDNDEPDPGSHDTVTQMNYRTALAEYILRKEIFEKEYAKGLADTARIRAIAEVDSFFIQKVENSFAKLERFVSLLKQDLENGNQVSISVKGYASPLNTAAYNKRLSARRISSLKNYLSEYQDGLFLKYMGNKDSMRAGDSALRGGLVILEEPMGASLAPSNVSSDRKDLRRSVYSPLASAERRIHILYYNSEAAPELQAGSPVLSLSNEFHDFGEMAEGEVRSFKLEFKNEGYGRLEILDIETSCGCTIVDWPRKPLQHGESAIINIRFDAHEKSGEESESITIKTNAPGGEKTVFFTAKVLKK